MRYFFALGILFITLSSNIKAADYSWSSAVPTEVHIIPEGLVLLGDFDLTGVACVTGSKAVYLPKTDLGFDAKLSLALTAKATGKKIEVLIDKSSQTDCHSVNAHGMVAVAHHYYWRLKY